MNRSWRILSFRSKRLHRPLQRYASKFAGSTPHHPVHTTATVGHAIIAWIGTAITLGVLGWLSEATGAPLMLASFGASCVLLFGYPESQFSQPRNTLGGHLIAALIGLAMVSTIGDHWLSMALAVATAIAAMKLTHTVHPPAGSTAIIAVHLHPDATFLVLPILSGASLLVVLAALFNNVIEHRRYPVSWR